MTETLPHNLEAEQAFLGALIYDNRLLHKCAEWLAADHFYDPVHGRIFTAIADRVNRGALADAIMLKADFERDGGIKEIGGAAYLAILLESAAEGRAAIEYGRIVLDLALRRELIAAADHLRAEAAALEDGATSAEIIEAVEARMAELASGAGERDRIHALHDEAERIIGNIVNGDATPSVTTGLPDLDRRLAGGLKEGKLYIDGGRPGMAKSILAGFFQIAAGEAGAFSPMYQFEMGADEVAERQLSYLCTRDTGLSPTERPTYEEIALWRSGKEKPTPAQLAALKRASAALADLRDVIPYIDAAGMTAPHIMAHARRLYRKAEARGLKRGPLVVDYLQLITPHTRRGDSMTAEVTDIVNFLKQMGRILGVPVLAVSQLSRAVENRSDKRPNMGDLRESGAIEQNADVIMLLYRDAYYANKEQPPAGTGPALDDWQIRCADPTLEIILDKIRGGKTGVLKVNCDVARARVDCKARDWAEEGQR